jgi:hypothetical protein
VAIVGVHGNTYARLPQVVGALGNPRPLLGTHQGRQEHTRQNSNNRDDHQELNQGEAAPAQE